MSPDRKPSRIIEQELVSTIGLPPEHIGVLRKLVEGGSENLYSKTIRQIKGANYRVFGQANIGMQLVDFNRNINNVDPEKRKNQPYYKKIRSLVLEVSSSIFHPGRYFDFEKRLPIPEAILLHGELDGLNAISLRLLQGLSLKDIKEKETAQNLLRFWQEFGIKQVLPE